MVNQITIDGYMSIRTQPFGTMKQKFWGFICFSTLDTPATTCLVTVKRTVNLLSQSWKKQQKPSRELTRRALGGIRRVVFKIDFSGIFC